MEKGLTSIQEIKKYLGNNESDYIVGYTWEKELRDLKNKGSISMYNLVAIRKSYPHTNNGVIKRIRIKIDSIDFISVFSQVFFEKAQNVRGLVFVGGCSGENTTISGYTIRIKGDENNVLIENSIVLPWRKEI